MRIWNPAAGMRMADIATYKERYSRINSHELETEGDGIRIP